MRAARIHAYGDPEEFRIDDVPRPTVGDKDVLIRVHATSVNPVDFKIRSGAQRGVVRLKLPWTLGMDVSGVVEEVGSAVTSFKVGDEVFSSPTHRRPGTYADYVAIDAAAVALKPTTVSHQEAASLPLVALTAWECLVETAKLGSGDKVLIHAGSGGVGSVGIQLAKALGAKVATTCSGKNAEFVRELGADIVVDYTKEEFEEVLSEYDVVLESLGGESYGRSLKILRRGGRLVSINSGLPAATKKYGPHLGVAAVGLSLLSRKVGARLGSGVRFSTVVRKCSGEKLAAIARHVDDGAIRPQVATVMPLERIADAHRAIETGRTRGKIVIDLDAS